MADRLLAQHDEEDERIPTRSGVPTPTLRSGPKGRGFRFCPESTP